MRKLVALVTATGVLLTAAFSGGLSAQAVAPAANAGQGEDMVVVPDRFLRRWDPVTVFFDEDTGPPGAGPEDDPTRLVTLAPDHPGAYTWLDAKTLQFRPAEPWPPLSRFEWRFLDGRSRSLTTLMTAPVETLPEADARDLEPIDAITLAFAQPLAQETLAQALRIELQALPGAGANPERWLDRRDFRIKPVEALRERGQPSRYVIALHRPIGYGTRVRLHLALSLADSSDNGSKDEGFWRLSFATAEPFRATHFGCADRRYPIAAEGIRYGRDETVQCLNGDRRLAVEFSRALAQTGAVQARNLIRLSPAVEDLEFEVLDRTLHIKGRFQSDTLYQLRLTPSPLRDAGGRALQLSAASELFVQFPPRARFLRFERGHGIVERLGPQAVPVNGRGHRRLDLRIHRVEALDRSYWPFPATPLAVDESARPPGPGEVPAPFTRADRSVTSAELVQYLRSLGSPAVSALIDLPGIRGGNAARFGLDLKPHLERLAGTGSPGTYLVGIRNLDGSTQRSWLRLQVTDLSLSAVEEEGAVHFAVTSLASGLPVANARIWVDGTNFEGKARWQTIANGRTDERGIYRWIISDPQSRARQITRIVVAKDADMLVLDPAAGPEAYRDGRWDATTEAWLQWTQDGIAQRRETPRLLCHIFTDRPVYRPEHLVHIKGYLRDRHRGRIEKVRAKGTVVVTGPGELEWRYPVDINAAGSFYHAFDEKKLPTGDYRIYFEDSEQQTCGSASLRKEAYRLPRFEVQLHGPERVPLDAPFDVRMTGRYYAGGRVSDRPLRWRVTQFPYTWNPKTRPGYRYSSDARFSGRARFEAGAALERNERTDAEGSATIEINPAAEPTAQPRRYVVEATVTGDDDRSVTNTREVIALPPFVLGLKAPRYLEHGDAIQPEIVVVDGEGELLSGQELTVRLLQRQWHSHLRAGDFTTGVAKYVTEVVDETISEETLVSGEQALSPALPIPGAGVYLVEVEARDRLGRLQTVRLDLFAAGDEPVTWARPPSKIFKATPDRDRYAPGDVASLVLESPFQSGRALAVVEEPERNRYEWIDIRNGSGVLEIPVGEQDVPRLPVHFLLMRGRVPGTEGAPRDPDLGKPTTLGATVGLIVEPVEHILSVELEHPERAQPGQAIQVGVTLRDHDGVPSAGEVTLWLVDQAVLALGTEAPLDPVPDFITERTSRVTIRDTRNLAFGRLPFQEQPGGGEAQEKQAGALLDNVSVRKNFAPVPYFNPGIEVGADGRASVSVTLPDSLTNFKLRAKAVSGDDRFGYGTGRLAVRLPVITQPALPRFVRPGDRFVAAAVGRVVEGEGGAGNAEIRLEGASLQGPAQQSFEWQTGKAERIEYPVAVPTPVYENGASTTLNEVTITMAVERNADGARDAFEVALPIRDDRRPVTRRDLQTLVPGQNLTLPAIDGTPRPGTLRRQLVVSADPVLARMAGGLSFLLEYPHGCTEQRISRARAQLALRRFRDQLALDGDDDRIDDEVAKTLEWIASAVDANNLIGYWPGSRGYVSLTAWGLQFLTQARAAGYPVDEDLNEALTASLRQALRSDYPNFIDGAEYAERVWALSALSGIGALDGGYAAELARRAQFLSLENVAQVVRSLGQGEATAVRATLEKRLRDGITTRLHQGREIYAGLSEATAAANPMVLPSEARTLAEILRTWPDRDDPRGRMVMDALIGLGQGDGWGDTNANASALLALTDVLASSPAPLAAREVRIDDGGQTQVLTLDAEHPLARHAASGEGRILLRINSGEVAVRTDTSFVPQADGSQVSAAAEGFVVSREWLRVGAGDTPSVRVALAQPGLALDTAVGDIVEEHVELVSPEERNYVAVVIPIAAGMEPLNPALATAPPEATPSTALTLAPTYTAFLDDHIAYYYDSLPAGTYHFYFRTQANITGEFIQPPAYAEMMYRQAVSGHSNGAQVKIAGGRESNQ